ncbi:helix-turn-helix domain-containing protein [Cohnella yongneupensis]|uniref:Helix-turn-helix domain-containing protein n=1 Tax=Cohnella yongneupensis TaxID=425006 RepID=A0ABW0R419_9BACL
MNRMSVKEVAAYIGASEYKIYEMTRMKAIPHYRIGSRILFRTETIEDWLRTQEVQNCRSPQEGQL